MKVVPERQVTFVAGPHHLSAVYVLLRHAGATRQNSYLGQGSRKPVSAGAFVGKRLKLLKICRRRDRGGPTLGEN